MAQGSSQENWKPDPRSGSNDIDVSSDSSPLGLEAATNPDRSRTPMLTGAIVALAAGIALVFGAVFYSMNASSIDPKTAAPVTTTVPDTPLSPAAQEAQNQQSSQTADGRVAPSKSQPGVTSGAAPAQ